MEAALGRGDEGLEGIDTVGLLRDDGGDEDHGRMLIDEVRGDDQGGPRTGLFGAFGRIEPNADHLAAPG